MNDKVHTNWEILSDKSLIGNYIQSNRLKQNKTQDQVAKDAGLSCSTMILLERGEKIRIDSLIRVLRILKLLYVMDVFAIQEQISSIEYAKNKKKKRKQASPQKNKKTSKKDIEW